MKNAILILSLVITACGIQEKSDTDSAASCDQPIVGIWNGSTVNDKIILGSDQKFQYVGTDGCKSEGTFACPTGSTGSVTVTISAATASAYCSQAGSYVCGFTVANSQMSYQCKNSAGKVGPVYTYKKS